MLWSLPQSRVPELMDDPAIAERDHLHALSALARINLVSRTAARLAADIRALLDEKPRPAGYAIVDIACGGGDIAIDLTSRLCRPGKTAARVLGVDVSPRAIERSQAAASRRGVRAMFEVRDVLAEGCPPCDIAVSSLFLHHLDDTDAIRLLRGMAAAARVGIVVSDLIRSRLGLWLAVVGTTILSWSRVARVDGPLSVRAARTPTEYRRLCDAAGLESATIRRVWPERVVIRWRRPASEGRR